MSGDSELFGDLPEQPVPEAPGRGTPRLRQPERHQLGWQVAAIDDLVARDHPVRAVWAFVQGLDLRALHDAVKAREGAPGQAPPAPGLQEGDGVACMRARRSPPPTKWTGNGATAQSCPHSRAFRFRSRTYSTKLASPRWPGRQCWLARRQRRGTRAHALPEWNVPRIRDQPIDRPALNLVGRPRPLILRPDSRACARTRCRSGSVGAFSPRPTRSRPRSASRH